MFCEAYERKLKAAAAGEPLSSELQQHLRVCPRCAPEWEVAQALFATMDQCLRQAVNVDAPASLIAGVRQRVIATERVTAWWKPALAFAVALLMVGGFAVRMTLRNSGKGNTTGQRDVVTAISASRSAQSVEDEVTVGNATGLETKAGSAHGTPVRAGTHHASGSTLASGIVGNREPASVEVLTPAEEAIGLEQYIQRLRTRMIQVGSCEEVKNGGPLEIHDVEIAEIDLGVMAILPLDGAK
jgi:hypothetical protein